MANAAVAVSLGRDVSEIVGSTDRDLFPEDWELLRGTDAEVIASGVSAARSRSPWSSTACPGPT